MPSLTRQTILIIVLVALAALLIFAGPAACRKWQSERAQARVERSQAEAASNSAADAVATVARAGEATAASEQLTRSNEREIRGAQGADVRVGAGVNAAGRAALCRREAYRHDPKCAAFRSK